MLENVIFCHQEDSNWPLSDSKTLKTKFDDIFAATKYTKALAATQKLRKDRVNDLKNLEKDLTLLTSDLETFTRIENDMVDIDVQLKEGEERQQEIDDRYNGLNSNMQGLQAKAGRFDELDREIARLQTQKDMLAAEVHKAEQETKTKYDDIKDLDSYLFQFEKLEKKHQEDIESNSVELKRQERTLQATTQKLQSVQAELSKMEALEEQHKKTEADCFNRAKKLCSQHMGDESDLVAKDRLQGFLQRMLAILDEKKQAVNSQRTKSTVTDQEFENKISALQMKEIRLKEKLSSATTQRQKNESRALELIEEIAGIETQLITFKDLNKATKDSERKLADFLKNNPVEDVKNRIEVCLLLF